MKKIIVAFAITFILSAGVSSACVLSEEGKAVAEQFGRAFEVIEFLEGIADKLGFRNALEQIKFEIDILFQKEAAKHNNFCG